MNPPTNTDAQDQTDMARLKGGQGAALDALMARHAQKLYHYLIRVLQDDAEAADLAQETFTRIYQNRARFKSNGKFSTWLYTIATNLARDRFRRVSRHPHVSLEGNLDSTDTTLKSVLPAQDLNPHESLDATERAEAVQRAVADLPEDLRVPLVLAEYENQSYQEIAAVLDCSAKAVEMRLYRARQQLRTSLRKMLEVAS